MIKPKEQLAVPSPPIDESPLCDCIFFFSSVFFGVFLLLSLCSLMIGASDYHRMPINNECSYKTRWEYVFPGYRLGCWLSEEIEHD